MNTIEHEYTQMRTLPQEQGNSMFVWYNNYCYVPGDK